MDIHENIMTSPVEHRPDSIDRRTPSTTFSRTISPIGSASKSHSSRDKLTSLDTMTEVLWVKDSCVAPAVARIAFETSNAVISSNDRVTVEALPTVVATTTPDSTLSAISSQYNDVAKRCFNWCCLLHIYHALFRSVYRIKKT